MSSKAFSDVLREALRKRLARNTMVVIVPPGKTPDTHQAMNRLLRGVR